MVVISNSSITNQTVCHPQAVAFQLENYALHEFNLRNIQTPSGQTDPVAFAFLAPDLPVILHD
jgi:hypothetical protein